jgi:cytochrome c
MVLALCLGAAAPVGHGGPIRAVAVGAGLVVSGGFDGSAIVWPEGVVLRAHEGAVNAVAVAGDGRVVTGGADGRVLIWRDGAVVADLAGHEGPVAAVAVDGGRIASASWDGTARLWTADGAVRVMRGHGGPVNAVRFAPGGRLVTAGYDGSIRAWTEDGTAEIHQLGAPQNAVAVAEDGEILSGGADGVLRLLVGGLLRSVPIDATPITALSLSADGSRIAVVSLGGAAMVVDRKSLAVVTVFLGTEHPLWAVAFDGDGVVTGGAGRVVRRWDAESGRLLGGFGAAPVADALPSNDRGAQVFRACSACHSLGPDDGGRAGPSLHGLFGRRIASVAGFGYSASLRQMELVWSAETVSDLFDRGPQVVTPGTRMPEQRIADPADRAALVRFLERATR